ncbi:winged helix-turn-helix transcriptional regulator, partial [Candidatus Berkelbacteria bacterium]|nr:winged helix-turn-helix transcriptional regulator [Candidatus Berkelbacteria bacterium]
ARVFMILSDQTRLKIIELLSRQKELCVTELALILDVSMPAISHHLRPMKDLGIVMDHRMGQEICYMLTASPVTKQILSSLSLFKKVAK